MKRLLPFLLPLAVTLALIGALAPATAQQQYDPGGKARVTMYPAPGTTPSGIPVTQSPLTAVAGTQSALSIATATALTIPATATVALIQAQGTNNTSGICLYWRDDGTNPTGSAGQQMSAGSSMFYKVVSLPIKLIQATGATCTPTISYYK